LVTKSVDVCVLNCKPEQLAEAIPNPVRYLALGELKGGIDPAGADEHWKTARSALTRIRATFSAQDLAPKTFFIGAAIVAGMAKEIWSQLESGVLTNAANLTNANQLAALCRWLVRV